MRKRLVNFGAGPAALPETVLLAVRDELLCHPDLQCSMLEAGHRSVEFKALQAQCQSKLRHLLDVPDTYEILFLQGGGRLQFSMIPMNLAHPDGLANYIVTGGWSQKALSEARKFCQAHPVWDGAKCDFRAIPSWDELKIGQDASYWYLVSNETIHGVQFRSFEWDPRAVVACDASSDFLMRPLEVRKFGVIFACAQKNAGIAGLTIVIIRRDLLERSRDALPGYLNYAEHSRADSMYNTPPTFPIYIFDRLLDWLAETFGDLAAIESFSNKKAGLIYDVIDQHPGVYQGFANVSARSHANVTFRLEREDQQSRFLDRASDCGFMGIQGHRSVGGIRVSLYNAISMEHAEAFASFMKRFAAE